MLLNQQRRIENLTQTNFGKKYGVSATAVSLWEKGKREIPSRVIQDIINFNGIPIPKLCPKCLGKGIIL